MTDDDILRIWHSTGSPLQRDIVAFARCILAEAGKDAEPLYVIFDGPPGPDGGRFVEVETAQGKSVRVGNWTQCLSDARYWQLGPLYAAPQRTAQDADMTDDDFANILIQSAAPAAVPQSDTPTPVVEMHKYYSLSDSYSAMYSIRCLDKTWPDKDRFPVGTKFCLQEECNELAAKFSLVKRENAELRTALETERKARVEAEEEYWETICPKCGSEFDTKDRVQNTFCPQCKGGLRGVLNSELRKREITQSQWDELKQRAEAVEASVQALRDLLAEIRKAWRTTEEPFSRGLKMYQLACEALKP